MGKASNRKKERKERRELGIPEPEKKSLPHIDNAVARKAIAVASRKGVIKELQNASTEEQIETLTETVARRKADKLKKALMNNAPKEMDKAIKQYKKEGKKITVDTLCYEIKHTPSFISMCNDVGLEISWFENLAKERMEKFGI